MSDVKAIRYLLAHYSPLTAVVPATRIAAGKLPVGTTLPALVVSHVTTLRRNTVSGQPAVQFCTSRVQVTVQASSYPEQKSVLKLVRDAIPDTTRGTFNGVLVDSALLIGEGPDFGVEDAEIYCQSHDYRVTFNE